MNLLYITIALWLSAGLSTAALIHKKQTAPREYLVSYMAKTEGGGWLTGSVTLTVQPWGKPLDVQEHCAKLVSSNEPPVVGGVVILSCVRL